MRHLVHDEARSVRAEDGNSQIYDYESQHLTATDGSITHTIRTEWIPDGIGVDVSRPAFKGWTPNSSAAFVSMVSAAGGCVANFPSDSVQRVNVADGAVTELGSVDVATGESQIIWEPDESVGRIQFKDWDESGQISFTAWTGSYVPELGGAVSVVFDTTTGLWQGC